MRALTVSTAYSRSVCLGIKPEILIPASPVDVNIRELAFNRLGLESHNFLAFLVQPNDVVLSPRASMMDAKHSRHAISSFLYRLQYIFVLSPGIEILRCQS